MTIESQVDNTSDSAIGHLYRKIVLQRTIEVELVMRQHREQLPYLLEWIERRHFNCSPQRLHECLQILRLLAQREVSLNLAP